MPQYIVINRHRAEECDPMEVVLQHLPEHLRGKDLLCTCPYGVHGYYMVLEGETGEEVILGLPPELQKGSQALQIEIFPLEPR